MIFSPLFLQLSAKDVSLLDERIKRSGVKAATSQTTTEKAPPSQSSETSSTHKQQPQSKQLKLKAK